MHTPRHIYDGNQETERELPNRFGSESTFCFLARPKPSLTHAHKGARGCCDRCSAASGRWPTRWRLDDRHGAGVLHTLQASDEFILLLILVSCRKNENISDTEKVLPTSFNYYHNLIYLLQLENRIFILLELLKPVDLPPWAVFKAVLADVALCQLSYMAPCQLRGR